MSAMEVCCGHQEEKEPRCELVFPLNSSFKQPMVTSLVCHHFDVFILKSRERVALLSALHDFRTLQHLIVVVLSPNDGKMRQRAM